MLYVAVAASSAATDHITDRHHSGMQDEFQRRPHGITASQAKKATAIAIASVDLVHWDDSRSQGVVVVPPAAGASETGILDPGSAAIGAALVAASALAAARCSARWRLNS